MALVRMIVLGLIVGLLARFFYPTTVDADWIVTIILGIVGSIGAGYLLQALRPAQRTRPFHPAGALISIVGGLALILIARMLHIL